MVLNGTTTLCTSCANGMIASRPYLESRRPLKVAVVESQPYRSITDYCVILPTFTTLDLNVREAHTRLASTALPLAIHHL